MNRRSFFRSLTLIGSAASLSPNIFIPKFEPVKWKLTTPDLSFNSRDFTGKWYFTMEMLKNETQRIQKEFLLKRADAFIELTIPLDDAKTLQLI